MVPKIEKIVENCVIAEGPHWDAETESLYFIDILQRSIYRYVPATQRVTKALLSTSPSLIIPVEGQKNKYLLTLNRELAVITWDGESDKVSEIEKLVEVENSPETLTNRFNDGKCDSSGRLWIGTMGRLMESGRVQEGKGALYSFKNGRITNVLDKISVSNGLAFNTDLRRFYYIDSVKGTIDEFDFDIKNGIIADPRPIFTLPRHDISGNADGMTIDTDGNLWVAIFNGSRVIKIDPKKPETLLYTLRLPAKQITSVTFGGKNMDELYVTSACWNVSGENIAPPDNGAVFKVTGLGAKGFPGVRVLL